MAQMLTALAVLPEHLGLCPSTYMVAYYNSSSKESGVYLCCLQVLYACHAHAYIQKNKHKVFFKKLRQKW